MTFALTSHNNEAKRRAAEKDGDSRGDSPTPRGGWRAIFGAFSDTCVRVHQHPSSGLRGLSIGDPYGIERVTMIEFEDRPLRALSLMAGYGSDASELRRLAVLQGWNIHITGVELCEARRHHLEKWCDDTITDDWRVASESGVLDGFDIIVTNPDFSHILRSGKVWSDTANKGAGGPARTPYLPVDETMVPTLLRLAPAVLMLHHTGAFADSEHGRDVYRSHPPAAEWKCGRIGFRGDGKTDVRPYITTLWLRGHEGSCASHSLPEFDRHWIVPPGSEEPSADLPAAPGWE